MICVLLFDRMRGTIGTYLQTWARSLTGQLRSLAYESLAPGGKLEGGAFIFGDLDRMTDAQRGRADVLATTIESAGGRVLNRPSRVLGRRDLLRRLHDSAANPFNVYRPEELTAGVRYPVFLRQEREHTGPLTPLLNNLDELRNALAQLNQPPRAIADPLIVEYLQTLRGEDGLIRKYAAMRIGDRIFPRHLFFSKDWFVKAPKLVTAQTVAEETRFLQDFPHTQIVRRRFDAAGIEYGRIDYSMFNDSLVTWEINTNPILLPFPEECDLERLAGQGYSGKLMQQAWLQLAKAKNVVVDLSGCPNIIEHSPNYQSPAP